MNQENNQQLTLKIKIQKLKQIVKVLEDLENNRIADATSCLLKVITETFEDVKQRLTELEKKQELQNSNPYE